MKEKKGFLYSFTYRCRFISASLPNHKQALKKTFTFKNRIRIPALNCGTANESVWEGDR